MFISVPLEIFWESLVTYFLNWNIVKYYLEKFICISHIQLGKVLIGFSLQNDDIFLHKSYLMCSPTKIISFFLVFFILFLRNVSFTLNNSLSAAIIIFSLNVNALLIVAICKFIKVSQWSLSFKFTDNNANYKINENNNIILCQNKKMNS